MNDAFVWLNGERVPAAQATVSVFDHGLLYGDGVFEGLRFYNRRVFRLEAHLQRLLRSAQVLALDLPYTLQELGTVCENLAADYAQPDGYIRLVVTRGSGHLGLNPIGCGPATVFVIAAPLALVSAERIAKGLTLCIASTRRLPLDGLDARVKSLNYLNNILARMEANAAGADEAIMLNAAGRVAEGSADNIFIVHDGLLLTPPSIDGALAGITRDVVLELAAELAIPALEQSLAPADLYTADEVFLTGTGAELLPVATVAGRRVATCPGPLFTRLSVLYAQRVRAG